MSDPIVIRVTATPNADNPGVLDVSVNPQVVFLSLEDLDQVRWVCEDGELTVVFGPARNPFDASAATASQYYASPGGSAVSGILAESLLPQNPLQFEQYEYSVVVTSLDGTRVGTLDPRLKPRRASVYQGPKKPL